MFFKTRILLLFNTKTPYFSLNSLILCLLTGDSFLHMMTDRPGCCLFVALPRTTHGFKGCHEAKGRKSMDDDAQLALTGVV